MFSYSKAAVERAMKIQEVILRAMAKKITWWQAAEILGFSDRHLRRIRERYQQVGYESMCDKRRSQQGCALRHGGESAGFVSGQVLRFERATFSREVTRGACDCPELHLGEVGLARGGAGRTSAPEPRPSQAPAAASLARDAAAHRREPSSVVPGRTRI